MRGGAGRQKKAIERLMVASPPSLHELSPNDRETLEVLDLYLRACLEAFFVNEGCLEVYEHLSEGVPEPEAVCGGRAALPAGPFHPRTAGGTGASRHREQPKQPRIALPGPEAVCGGRAALPTGALNLRAAIRAGAPRYTDDTRQLHRPFTSYETRHWGSGP